jgi:hypothetical protein
MKSQTYGEAAFGPVSLSVRTRPVPLTRLLVEENRFFWGANKIPPRRLFTNLAVPFGLTHYSGGSFMSCRFIMLH